VGALPLLPYALPGLGVVTQFLTSLGVAAGVFLGIGMLKSAVYGLPAWRSGLRTLCMGSAAAGLAFVTGHGAQMLLGG
jgi:VIT1/CCC1 family predicted Fe2+/Mn2+ transporter